MTIRVLSFPRLILRQPTIGKLSIGQPISKRSQLANLLIRGVNWSTSQVYSYVLK